MSKKWKFKMRVKFKKGEQRKFLKKVLEDSNCPSLRAFLQFGFDVPYSTLKNYFNESRLISKDFFLRLCEFIEVSHEGFNVEYVSDSWGQVVGGKKSRR